MIRLEVRRVGGGAGGSRTPLVGRDIPDRCWPFRVSEAWTLVTLRRSETYGDTDQPVGAWATFASSEFAAVGFLAEHVYDRGAWVDLLDAGCGHNKEL